MTGINNNYKSYAVVLFCAIVHITESHLFIRYVPIRTSGKNSSPKNVLVRSKKFVPFHLFIHIVLQSTPDNKMAALDLPGAFGSQNFALRVPAEMYRDNRMRLVAKFMETTSAPAILLFRGTKVLHLHNSSYLISLHIFPFLTMFVCVCYSLFRR
jgi:hypothetical protein